MTQLLREKLRTKKHTARQIVDIQKFLEDLFDGDVHAKRVESLANATLGVVTSACLAVSIIGKALAQARGLLPKHAVKQVDRLLSNQGIVVWDLLAYWVPEVVGQRRAIVVAMDWTDYDADGQATLVLSLVTSHGRATPLVWLSVHNSTEALFRKDKSYLKFLGRVTAGATGQASDEADSEALSEGSDGPGDMAFRSDGRAVGVGELGIGQVFG